MAFRKLWDQTSPEAEKNTKRSSQKSERHFPAGFAHPVPLIRSFIFIPAANPDQQCTGQGVRQIELYL